MHKSPTLLTRELCRDYIENHLFSPGTPNTGRPPGEVGFIGLELESFPYCINSQKKTHTVNFNGGNDSLLNVLRDSSEAFGGVARYLDKGAADDQQRPLTGAIEFPDGSSFQFEPGGQTEISTAPCDSIEKVNAQLKSRQEILRMLKQKNGIHFAQFGTNPWFNAEDIGFQMNKIRYRAMAHYFDGVNSFGKKMMLQTCSLQVNLDLGIDWATRIKRIIAANLLAPFVTALFANSPVIAGKVNGYKSYRSLIWQHLDPCRTGVLPLNQLSKTFSKEDLIDAYLEFALKAPIIYIEEFGNQVFPRNFTLEYWITNPIQGLLPGINHLKNHLSLLFPEVRLKGYLELRSADVPPPEWQMIPAYFYSGLLYSNRHLDKTIDMLLPFASQLPTLMEKATCGLETEDIFNTSKNLMHLAIEGFSGLPDFFKNENDIRQFVSFFERFTMERKTFADECLERFHNDKFLFPW
ncbi:MAG: glutamate-cysteine ligase family protein [Ginsengibacter sp.]